FPTRRSSDLKRLQSDRSETYRPYRKGGGVHRRKLEPSEPGNLYATALEASLNMILSAFHIPDRRVHRTWRLLFHPEDTAASRSVPDSRGPTCIQCRAPDLSRPCSARLSDAQERLYCTAVLPAGQQ